MGTFEWIALLAIALLVVSRLIQKKGIQNITVQEAKEKIHEKNVQCIDVRTPREYKAFNRPQFKNIPLNELPNKLSTLDKNKEIVLICQSGLRSARAAKLLSRQGFKSIYNVKGGMNAWH